MAGKIRSNVQIVQDVARTGRKSRRPQHTFQIRQRPWHIQPFMIAPVLPGDTLKNLLLQARVVSDPVKNPLIGWWMEYYFFYVPHRALAGSADYQAMMLNPSATAGNLQATAADVANYTPVGWTKWSSQCLDCVTDWFFRDEGEATLAGTFADGLPLAQLARQDWLDSVMTKAAYDANEPPDVALVDGSDADTTLDMSEFEVARRQYEMLRDMRLTDATYEDFLRTYGVKTPEREFESKPELLRYVKEWTYPSNTVEPSTGVPSSALSWSIAEKADKDRFFREPGFIFGVSVARPKVYLSKQGGAAVGLLYDVFKWLPAVLGGDPYGSLVNHGTGAGLLEGTGDVVIDVKDLYLYGDQFVNFARTETDAGMVAVPTAALVKKYAASADADGLFSNAAGGKKYVRMDGVVALNILSRVVDTTAKT